MGANAVAAPGGCKHRNNIISNAEIPTAKAAKAAKAAT
jgi:hypothetical protein